MIYENQDPKLSKEEKKEKIQQIDEKIEKKRFSNEFLDREIYINEYS